MFSIEQWSITETVIEVMLPATGVVYYLAFVGDDREGRIDRALPAIHRAVIGIPAEIAPALNLADSVWTAPAIQVVAETLRDEMILRGITVKEVQ